MKVRDGKSSYTEKDVTLFNDMIAAAIKHNALIPREIRELFGLVRLRVVEKHPLRYHLLLDRVQSPCLSYQNAKYSN